VLTQVEQVVVTQDELMTDKVSDQQETTNEIYLLRNKIAIDEEEGDINRQSTVDVLREEELARSNETIEADGYEKAENLRSKETIHEALVSTETENTTRDGVHLDNTEKLTSITLSQAEMIRQQAEADALVNVNADQTIDDVKTTIAENDNDRSEERKKVEEQVKVLHVASADKTDELTTSKTDEVQTTKKGIEDVKITASELEKDGAVQTESNENQLKVIEIEVNNGVQNLENKQTESSYELNRGVELINLSIEENKVERDLNRLQTDATLRDESLAIEEKQFEDYSNETVKYLQNKNQINNAVATTVQIDEIAEDKHAIKVEEVKKIDKNMAIVNVEADLTDEQMRQKAKSTIVVANTATELNSTTSTKKQEVNSYKMSDVSKAKESEQIGQEAKDIDKHYDTQKQLNSVDNTKPTKVIVANTLGQEYPEGVSQESFTQSDENGLMTSIITRRVVVINGQGNVYVRTQTLNSITYTKNGEASTEYVWQKETQSSKLERHF
jgi:epidermal growth factor receptor substrate 15